MKRSACVTKVKVLARPFRLFRGLALAIAIVPASLAGTALAVDINQHGLTGSWYNPTAAGQGIEIEIYQDAIAPGVGYLQASWATFSVGWETGQRWYTFGGTIQAGQSDATFTVFENSGGKFNAPPATQGVAIGTVALTFLDCSTATMKYQDLLLDRHWGPFSNTIPLVRLTPNVACSSADSASRPNADFSYSGHWFDPAIRGQGLFVELNPIAEVSFVVWYTYSRDGFFTDAEEETQRWYTAQGKLVAGAPTQPVTLYETNGGVIGGSSDPAFAVGTQMVGTAMITFFDCDTAQWTFNFFAGSNAGASGTINLSRVGPVPNGCGS